MADERSQVRLIHFDEQTVPGTSLKDLDPKLWTRFRTPLSARDDQEFLGKMKLIARDEDGDTRSTVSGILMATDTPESFISSAFIQAASYRGTERNAAYQLDAKDNTGPLDVQIRDACKFVEVYPSSSLKARVCRAKSLNTSFLMMLNSC